MVEILNTQWGDLRPVFEREFQGMVVEPVTAEELRIAGEQLVSRLHEEITQEERRFIVSVKEGKPQWDLLGCQELRISLPFNGSFKTYAEWHQ